MASEPFLNFYQKGTSKFLKMISVTDLRRDATFKDQNEIYQVLTYEHVKMGRGTANVKLKVKNLKTGAITQKSFISGAKVEEIKLAKKELQFLYKDKIWAVFMDPVTFEQINISLKILPEHQFLKEGEMFGVSFLSEEPLALNLPAKMEFRIAETGPAVRGNSATNVYKDAILENGLKTKVPLFIKIGDKVLIDTKTGDYDEKRNTA